MPSKLLTRYTSPKSSAVVSVDLRRVRDGQRSGDVNGFGEEGVSKMENFKSELLRTLPVSDERTPVDFVCYHPIAERNLRRGDVGEGAEPSCLAVRYEYDSILGELCAALGWSGGTIHQVIAEIKRLKSGE